MKRKYRKFIEKKKFYRNFIEKYRKILEHRNNIENFYRKFYTIE